MWNVNYPNLNKRYFIAYFDYIARTYMLSSYMIFSQNIRKKFEEPELKRKMKDAEVVKINGL